MSAVPVRTGVGRTIASWRLRALLAIAVLVMLLTVAFAFAPPIWLAVALVLAATATVGNPRSHAATVLIAVVIFTTFAVAASPGWWLPVLVFTLHATHIGASLSAVVPTAGDIEVDALRPSLRRFAAVQAVAQAFVVIVLGLAP